MSWAKCAIHTIGALILAFATFNVVIFNFFDFLDIGRKEKVNERACFVKKGIVGAEDQTDWNHQCIFSSSSDRMNMMQQPPNQTHLSQGAIWLLCGF